MRRTVVAPRAGALVVAWLALLQTAPSNAQSFHALNDNGRLEIGFAGNASLIPDASCPPPLVAASGSVIAGVGDDAANAQHYVVLSFDTQTWSAGSTFRLFLRSAAVSGSPFGPGRIGTTPMFIDYALKAGAVPSLKTSGEAVGYTTIGGFTQAQIFSTLGLNLSTAFDSFLGGAHARFLHLRFRFPYCTNGDGAADAVVFLTGGSGIKGSPRILQTAPGLDLDTGIGQSGDPVGISLLVSGFTPTSGTLLYRRGGSQATFDSLTMAVSGQSVLGTIPGSEVTPRGVEYYVRVFSAAAAFIAPPGAPTTPDFIPVTFARQSLRPPPDSTFILVGIPFVASDPSPSSVLFDDLGSYDPSRWRLGRFDPQANGYGEFPSVPNMDPGTGFWLVQADAKGIAAGGQSTNSVQGVTLALQPGWNQIAHPFLFNVPTSVVDLSGAPDVPRRFVGRAGNAYVDASTLVPWEGYWVRNNGDSAESIRIPGIEETLTLAPSSTLEDAPPPYPHLELDVDQGKSGDRGNLAVLAAGASARLDRFDLDEPPMLPGSVGAYFVVDGANGARPLTADWRPIVSGGATWEMVVTTAPGPSARVTVRGLESIDSGFEARLLPLGPGEPVDLRARPSFDLEPDRTQRFQLVVGPADYQAAARAAWLPTSVALEPAFPNPLRDHTEIVFALSAASNVTLVVFDLQGRLVRTLADGSREAGRHRVTWDGRDADGRVGIAGVYFYRLDVGRFTTSRKLLVLR